MNETGPRTGFRPAGSPNQHRQLQINKNRKGSRLAMENHNPLIEGPDRSDGVKITLRHRHYGVHKDVAEVMIPGAFSDYAKPRPGGDSDDYVIDEDCLLAVLPHGFLPCPPARILLAVENDTGGTGQRGLSRFRDWAKYFDAYCLNLVKDGPEAGR